MKDRILAISNHGVFIGGGEHSFFDLLSRLRARVQILGVVPERAQLFSRLVEEGIETRIIDLPALRPWYTHKMLSSLAAFRKLCAAYRPALIYANGSRAAFYSGIIGRFMGIPVIWHCRIVEPDPFLDYILCRLSSRIIINSFANAKRFKAPFQRKIKLVYNAVDLKRFNPGCLGKPDLIRKGWNVVLVVARATKEKNHDVLLSAFEMAANHDSSVHLVCLGAKDPRDPEWWQYLQNRTGESPFSERIHWVGHAEDVRPWYRAASFLALGSTSESFGRVIVEAMACGLPVIATRVGAIPEIIREDMDGLLVAPGSISEMAEGFSRLLGDDLLRQRFRESGLERARYFDLESHIHRMISVFEECIKK